MVTAVDKDGRQRRQQQHRSQHGAMSVQRYLVRGSSASECAGRKPVSLSMRAGGRPSGYINGIRAVGEEALCPSSVSWSLVAGHSLPLGDARRDLIYLSPLAALHHLFPTAWIPGIFFFFLLCVRLLRAACLASAAPPYNHNDAGSKLRRVSSPPCRTPSPGSHGEMVIHSHVIGRADMLGS